MSKATLVFACLLSCLAASVRMQAQYQPNPATEEAFADLEVEDLGTPPTPITVPHLGPYYVVQAMEDPDYLPTGTTPFTFVIAHRGSHSAPGCAENSACAIAAAYEAGADAIELDVKVTNDGAPVLGHDVAIARELNNWIDASGNSVTRTSAWTPFSNFPILDYSYLKLTKWPFLNDFDLPNFDSNNPTRTEMNLTQIEDSTLVDTYNQLTPNHQLTLYEALYIITKYYPMAIFLDVKNANDLNSIAKSGLITIARGRPWNVSQKGGSTPLADICLKLGWSTVKTVSGNPSIYMHTPGISYFLVFGTGDLDNMAIYNSQPTPTSPSQALSQAYASFKSLCLYSGCLGAELSHKYLNAPTQGMYNDIASDGQTYHFQLAGFQTVPQYSWYWQTLLTQKEQAATYGRTFPRTDGSCCFALTDSLNISKYIGTPGGQLTGSTDGSEIQDLRGLYSWNEAEFSTITTDEPLTVLRDLYKQGRRSVDIATQIGSNYYNSNLTVPSGGAASDIGPFPDGLYYIQATGDNNYLLAVSGTGSGAFLTLATPGQPTSQQMWYLSGKPGQHYTLTNAATDLSISVTQIGSQYSLGLGIATNSETYLWSMPAYGGGGGLSTILSLSTNAFLGYGTTSPQMTVLPSAPWQLVPIATPSSEKANQQRGPAGYTYCADGDVSPVQTCNFTGPGSVAYGVNGNFRYLAYTTGPVSCQISTFNGIDPAPGIVKACFYAPYDTTARLPTVSNQYGQPAFSGETVNQGDPIPASSQSSWARGVVDPTTGAAMYTYQTLPNGGTCDLNTFGDIDPAPNMVKQCIQAASVPAGPSGYSYCAGEGQNCVFSGTAAVAYGAGSSFTYKTFANGVKCGVVSFGLDPDPNVVKACFYMAATPLGTVTNAWGPAQMTDYNFTKCATGETGTCTNVPVGSLVAYGTESGQGSYTGPPSYDYITNISTSVACRVSTFGNVDPAPGYTKACYWSPQSWVNRGPVGYTFCALLGGTCQFNGVAEVAYGDDGYFVYLPTATNGIACNLTAFGGTDPHFGFVKACFYRLY